MKTNKTKTNTFQYYSLVVLTVGCIASTSSAATLLWTKQWGSSADDAANNVAFDGSGSIYVGGGTHGSFAGQTNPGGDSGMLNKFLPDGTFVWARIYGSGQGYNANSAGEGGVVVTDGAGAIYTSGRAAGPFDGQPFAGGNSDFYLRKFDSSGNRQWTRIWGSSANGETMFDAVMGGGGIVYLTGFEYASIDGQPYGGDADPVVFRVDAQGNRISTWEWGTGATEPASGIAVDASGNSYVVGAWPYPYNCTLTKLDASGNRLWTSVWGPTVGWPSVTADTNGNVYVITTATGVIGGQPSFGGQDANLTKVSPSGVLLWTRTWGSSGNDSPGKPVVGTDGNIYVPGNTTGSFDGQTNSIGTDGFVSVFTPNGSRLWTQFLGIGQYGGNASSIAFDRDGNLLMSGQISGTFPGQTNSGGTDAILMKWALGAAPSNTVSVDIKMFAGIIINNAPIGSNYLIQANSSLTSTNWTTLTNVAIPTQPYIYIDYNSPTNSKQFYRALPQ